MFIILVLLLAAIALLLFYASYSISWGVYVKCLCENGAKKDSVALTFDDGVDSVMTPKVLHILKRYDAKATFFIIGKKASDHPEIVRMIIDQGHSIGNHSYYHNWTFPMQSVQMAQHEIDACTQVLEKVSGVQVKLFRPPFGVTNPIVAKAIKRSGLVAIGWSIRSFDTMGLNVERVTKRIIRRLKAGRVILLHDNRPHADQLLEQLLLELQQRGLKSVGIEKLFNLEK